MEDYRAKPRERGNESPITRARMAAGMTQKDLAEAIGVTRQTVNAIEKGDYNPTVRLCVAICKVLGKTLDELFWEA